LQGRFYLQKPPTRIATKGGVTKIQYRTANFLEDFFNSRQAFIFYFPLKTLYKAKIK